MHTGIEYRTGVIAGVRAALEVIVLTTRPEKVREFEDWLKELEHWNGGPMPPGPSEW